jgi:hypothetical protein
MCLTSYGQNDRNGGGKTILSEIRMYTLRMLQAPFCRLGRKNVYLKYDTKNLDMEVKERIVSKINQIHDESILSELEILISNLQEKPYPLSAEMIESLEKSEDDIREGNLIPHEQVMHELSEWINGR